MVIHVDVADFEHRFDVGKDGNFMDDCLELFLLWLNIHRTHT
jgi:hypothetical protein